MKGIFKEFKTFTTKSSVIDLAVGVAIGGAFGKIASSLVNDIIIPVFIIIKLINVLRNRHEEIPESRLNRPGRRNYWKKSETC